MKTYIYANSQIIARELGHRAFALVHPDQQVSPDHDTDDLMHSSASCPERLRKG
ncbi:MAG: hypothetical protein ACYSW4_08035 [Planctomycetota bacterium]